MLDRPDETQLICNSCNSVYPIDEGIPVLLPLKLDEFKRLEAEYHSNNADEFAEKAMKISYRVSKYHDNYLKALRSLEKNSIVFEVSGGSGIEAVEIKKMGLSLIESDIALGMVKRARKRENDERLPKSLFVVCDAEQLPCNDNSVNAVLIVGLSAEVNGKAWLKR